MLHESYGHTKLESMGGMVGVLQMRLNRAIYDTNAKIAEYTFYSNDLLCRGVASASVGRSDSL